MKLKDLKKIFRSTTDLTTLPKVETTTDVAFMKSGVYETPKFMINVVKADNQKEVSVDIVKTLHKVLEERDKEILSLKSIVYEREKEIAEMAAYIETLENK